MIARLETLDAEVARAEARVAELELERTKATRAHDRAMGPLRDYHHEIGRGAEPDPEREAELERDLESETRHLVRRPILTGGQVSDWEVHDERVEAQLAGAIEVRDEAIVARDVFLNRHRADLAAEAAPAAEDAAREVARCHEELREASAAFHAASQPLLRFGVSLDAVPEAPAVDYRKVAAVREFAERGLHRPEVTG